MSYHTLTSIAVPVPAYSHCSNSIRVLTAILVDFLAYASYEREGFHCDHDAELPAIRDLIARSKAMEEDGFYELDAIQDWLLEFAVIAPGLWD